jgi:glycerol uptake facilitator-like aquaporin
MTSAKAELPRALAAEALGTALLVAGVVGSGIMAQRLTQDGALALLCNTIATGALLAVLILVFAPVSKAHFNPVVSLAFALRGEIAPARAIAYTAAQIGGGIAGTWLAHAMFGLAIFASGLTVRTGAGHWLAEAVATFGLLLTIFGCAARKDESTAYAVGLYITAAYWFTASTSFANPAVTIARALTPSFAGIRPLDAPMFIMAQIVGASLATLAARYLFATPPPALLAEASASGDRACRPAPSRGA